METPKLFLLDAYALIYRAYYALIRAPRVTSSGINTTAVLGFCNTLHEILRKEDPSHMAVCFDPPGGKTFRHERFDQYKAQRDKQPEDITLAIPYIKEILAAYRIPVIEIPSYEADDVIGTLANMAQRQGIDTYMVTLDKDYAQLVTDHIFMYRLALRGEGFEIRGPREICERYGIKSPAQVIDLLALEGDTSDNIPGCPNIGPKKASLLIDTWGSVDSVIEHADQIPGAMGKNIRDNIPQIQLSKWLVTIDTDVPLPGITPESLRRKEIDLPALLDVYRRLEFRTFITQLHSRFPSQTITDAPTAPKSEHPMGSLFDLPEQEDPIPAYPYTYTQASSPAQVAETVSRASAASAVGINVLASGTDAMTAHIHGIAIAHTPGDTSFIPLSDPDIPQTIAIIQPLLSDPAVTLCSPDFKRDYILLRRLGADITAPYFDTAVAHYILQPEMQHDITRLARHYLSAEIPPAPTPKTPDPELARRRTAMLADAALRLRPILLDLIHREDMTPLLTDIELPLITVLAEMEYTGVRIDTAELHELSHAYTLRLDSMEQQAYTLAGRKFNTSSPLQVGDILFNELDISPKPKRTKTGAYSTTEEILEKYRHDHPIVDLILRIRALRKLLATYINALPGLVNPHTHKIHTSYNQTVTATGRISSTNPNLQNIPIRSDDGREIRRAFIPDPGDIMLAADYSQIELRLMAHLSQDPAMIQAFLSGADIHQATAAKIFHVDPADVTPEQRRRAKTANFGIIYGISPFGLSERLSIPRAEAKALIEGYFRTYPGVKDYMEQSIDKARLHQYVTTLRGRKRALPDINSRSANIRGYAERNAINAPIQGSAADIIKIAMIGIYREFKDRGLRSRMTMQVHDELVFNVTPAELALVTEIVTRHMQSAYTASVPLEVSVGTGKNWLEAH